MTSGIALLNCHPCLSAQFLVWNSINSAMSRSEYTSNNKRRLP